MFLSLTLSHGEAIVKINIHQHNSIIYRTTVGSGVYVSPGAGRVKLPLGHCNTAALL